MDERLTLLERAVRKADGAALTELVGRLERLLTPAEVEARVTDLVDEANLDPGVWMPALVGAFGVEGFRRARALTFDTKGKKGRDVEELQFERHGAAFGLRPETASLLVIDADDREVSYASDVTPALLLRLLRDRARLDLDFDAPEMTPDPFDEDDRFLEECEGLELERRGPLLEANAAPLALVLGHEPGPVVSLVHGVRLHDREEALTRHGVHFEAGDGLPRRVYTAFDLRRCCERLSRDAGRTHRSRSDLDAFLGWTVRLRLDLEVEPFEHGFGARFSFIDLCRDDECERHPQDEGHDVAVSSPLRATAAEVLEDVLTLRLNPGGGWWRGEGGWSDSHDHRPVEEDGLEHGGDDEDDRVDIGFARDD